MRHKLERSEFRTLLIVAVGVIISAWSSWMVASTPATSPSHGSLNAMCPHWTEC